MKSTQVQSNLDNIQCLLVDLDDTLYPHAIGVWALVRDRILEFMSTQMNFRKEEVPDIRQRLYKNYGTTLRGLQAEYSVDMDAFLNYVHDIPIESVISPDPDLDRLLHALPQRKIIFTNAPAFHARRVLKNLDVADHFDTILDVYTTFPHCKPEEEAFQKVLKIIDEDPKHCIMFDDSPRNLETAQTLGMTTVSIGERPHNGSPHFERFHDIETLFNKN
jgi:putative hydrolase of the HAD superfamily